MKKYNYSYITTNLNNQKQYVGDHSTDNLEDGYLGSGLYIQRAVKKYGKENFKREILEFFNTKQEAFNAQEKWIKEYNTLVPNGYNISPIGGVQASGGMNLISRQKLSKTRIDNQLAKGKNNPMFGISLKDKWINIYGEEIAEKKYFKWVQMQKEYKPTEESKQKISETLKGRKPWNIGLSKKNDDRLTKSAITMSKNRKGILKSLEHKINMSKSHKDPKHIKECPHCNKIINNSGGAYTKYHGENCNLNPKNI